MKSKLYSIYEAEQKRHPNAFVFYRLGDFYELFGDKAKEFAERFDLTYTGRCIDNETGERVYMCGIPYCCRKEYESKLKAVKEKVIFMEA